MTAFEVEALRLFTSRKNGNFLSQKSKKDIQPTTTTVLLYVVSFSSRLVPALGLYNWSTVQGNHC
jgi:hypothetical protein